MKFILNKDKLIIEETQKPNSGSVKYYEIPVEYDESWQDLTIKAVLVEKDAEKGRSVSLINNRVYIDNELDGTYKIGFVGYTIEYDLTEDTVINKDKTYYTRSGTAGSYVYTKVENPTQPNINTYYEATKTYQISTNLKAINFNKGAGQIEAEEGTLPTPTEWEIYIAQLQEITNTINGLAEDLDAEVQDIITQLENGDFDGADGITPTIGQNGNWYLGDVDTGKPSRGIQGETGQTGEDGYSPTATVTQVSGGATISITDKNGTTTANIFNGINGQDGKDGKDGADGKDGKDGTNGTDGQDGYTPVRGVDYWTNADKQEIISDLPVYIIPEDVFELDTSASSSDIITAFGGSDKYNEFLDIAEQGNTLFYTGTKITTPSSVTDFLAETNSCSVFYSTFQGTPGVALEISVMWASGYVTVHIIKPTNNNWQTPYIDSISDVNVLQAEDRSNKVTSISSNSTHTQYPSAKCVYDIVGNIETLLSNI